MDSLRKLRSKVIEKIPVSSDKNKKVRDKTIRHSRSLPLLPPSDTEHVRPVYKGNRPLKPSDIRHPNDLISPEAFSRRPAYKGGRPVKPSDIRHPMEFSLNSIDLNKSKAHKVVANSDIMIQFPSPPTHTPSSSISRPSTDSEYRPTRPSTRPAPLDDIYPDLLPPSIVLKPTELAEEKRRYNAIEAVRGRKQSESLQEPLQRHRNDSTSSFSGPSIKAIEAGRGRKQSESLQEPLQHHRNDSASSFSRPSIEAYPETVRRYYHIREDSVQSQRTGLTSHSNYSTQSLGANARLRDGPTVHRPIVRTASTASNSGPGHRQRMPSSVSVNNDPISVPRTLPVHSSTHRQRNASSTSVNNAPISAPKALHAHGSVHRQRTASSASGNRPLNSAAAIYRQRMPSVTAASGPPNSIARHPQYQTTAGRRVFKREPHSQSDRRLADRSSKESLSASELGYVMVSPKVDPTFWRRIPGDTYERDDN
ncbi:hypothetical protein K443DRAFT_342 [Laccaria amethystina LaAM-08-1]|uniref:Uncharacterized protein n=1 Tax=Laccaria amethystina LaAM-08-1 TaxID=1095629 RepID=A0A0C9YH67_9AGAR|nr:hypothetical protein K443DRAFT_342 [Laccaria amethystina LaAM-08-1]